MDVAALLLTGGSSRRMGRDKATLVLADGRAMSARTAALLAVVAAPVLEVGPGASGADAVADGWPGAGPLAAVASGVTALRADGWRGSALVVATDLPRLDVALLRWLAEHPFTGTVIPVVGGHPQLLCARYDAATLAGAPALVEHGHRRMAHLIDGRSVHRAGPDEWSDVSDDGSLCDVDTPDDLAALVDPTATADHRLAPPSAPPRPTAASPR